METQPLQQLSPHIWVALGRFDFPVQIPLNHTLEEPEKKNYCMFDLGQGSGDCFFEYRPVDVQRVSNTAWWSEDEPVLFECRASIIAILPDAKRRVENFVEYCLDWLSLCYGVAAGNPRWQCLYDETELNACYTSDGTTFTLLNFGKPTFTTTGARNHLIAKTRFDEDIARCARWLRKAMLSTNIEDRFLLWYATCETLSRKIKDGDKRQTTCKLCNNAYETGTDDHAGFKHILKELFDNNEINSKEVYRRLNRLRGSIAHGGKHPKDVFLELLEYESIIKAAALASLAQVTDIPRESLNLLNFGCVDISPICQVKLEDYDPSAAWGCSITERLRKTE